MSDYIQMESLSVMVDMAGCPNRCRHCWLGDQPNRRMEVDDFKYIAAQFRDWRDERGDGIGKLGFFSWWREPDFRNDYRELWALEQALSDPAMSQRFELLSIWRLARDESYAAWAATLEPKACQITFFGMEANTDWGINRKGAYQDNLLAANRLIEAGIAPRFQLFLTKKCLGELDDFMRMMDELKLIERCERIGQPFEFFIGGMSPEGRGYDLEALRVEKSDLARIPREMIALSRDGIDMLGQPECELCEELIEEQGAPNMGANMKSISINADLDVFPNIAEPAEWWRLGNLKHDGVDVILKAYRDETTPGMRANRALPLSELTQKFGDKGSEKLYDKGDLICRFMHQWGAAQAK